MESVVIRGISLERDQAKVTIQGLPDLPGVASRVFNAIAGANLNIDMIVQNVGQDGKARISFTLHKNDIKRGLSSISPVAQEYGASVSSSDGIAKLSAVGIGMRSHSGVAAQMFQALGEAGCNIQMISTSEIKISVTIDQEKAEEAARAVHRAFRLHEAG